VRHRFVNASVPHPLSSVVAPAQVLRGWGILEQLEHYLPLLGKRPLVIGGELGVALFQEQDLPLAHVAYASYGVDCTYQTIEALIQAGQEHRAGMILGVGGGKALDAAKLVAYRLDLPVVTIPTSAATCAAWAPLSNLYSGEGTWLEGVELPRAPELLLLDYGLVQKAPVRTLVAGIGDALAKWYESSVSSGVSATGGGQSDVLVIAAVQQARILRDILFLKGEEAVRDPQSKAWEQVVDANILLAGLVGGLGGERCRTVAAHAVHNALTTLPKTRSSLHGEKVALGILVQLRLEETLSGNRLAEIARQQLIQFYRAVGLPMTLTDLNLGSLTSEMLLAVARHACAPESDLHYLPFTVPPEALVQALVAEETVLL
jgi:glycerol dehydrogenase-like iron-containing ADH family enzyme